VFELRSLLVVVSLSEGDVKFPGYIIVQCTYDGAIRLYRFCEEHSRFQTEAIVFESVLWILCVIFAVIY